MINYLTLDIIFDFLGSFAFCLSGASVGSSRKMDFFGIYIISMVSGFGGGCLRDIILGNNPPFVFQTPLCWIIGLTCTFIVYFPLNNSTFISLRNKLMFYIFLYFTKNNHIKKLTENFSKFGLSIQQKKKIYKIINNIFDGLGLAFFTVVGIRAGLAKNLHPFQCVIMGVFTSCFGGVLRDIIINRVPYIFHKEIYAILSIGGGTLYFILSSSLKNPYLEFIIIGVVFIARVIAIRYDLHLPKSKINYKNN